MSEKAVKLPDVGEGIAEAELVELHVKVGDVIREDDLIAAVMTDKATVDIPSPFGGEVRWVGAQVGDTVPIGSTLVLVDIGGDRSPASEQVVVDLQVPASSDAKAVDDGSADGRPASVPVTEPLRPEVQRQQDPVAAKASPSEPMSASVRSRGIHAVKPTASPSVRLAAREAGIDLRQVVGSGPAGRVTHADLAAFGSRDVAFGGQAGPAAKTSVTDVKVVGLRRRIAERMTLSKSRIPHITIVEEVDVTALEELRASLNAKHGASRPKLTVLPFVMLALSKALAEFPALNAVYDDDAGIVHQHAGVHVGIATQTPGGLMVPVIRHAEAKGLWDCAAELAKMADKARSGSASREELTGSTITITSLGALGGIATTPVINYPEVAIVGVNRMAVRPMWDGKAFAPRKMMNVSSSFDHRVIDGWDAAVFVQRLKELLELPATIFIGE